MQTTDVLLNTYCSFIQLFNVVDILQIITLDKLYFETKIKYFFIILCQVNNERILDMFIYHLYTSSKRSYLIKESYFILNIIFTTETTNYTQVLLHLLQSNKMYRDIWFNFSGHVSFRNCGNLTISHIYWFLWTHKIVLFI